MPKLVEMCHDNDFDVNDDHELDEWCDGYKITKNRRKRQVDLDAVELCIATMHYKHWTHAKEVFKPLTYNQKTVGIAKAFCYLENYTQNYQ